MTNTETGFIVLFRAFTTWEWYDDALTVKLFIHLILTVNWEDKKWRGQTIKRGQIITSLSNLAKASNMSVMQVRKRLSDLESTGEITTNRTNRFTLVTVVKYDIYQDKDRIRTNKQQTNNNQTTTTKPLKQLNNNNMADFEVFWNEYNHKHKKADSKKLWSKLKKTEKDLIMIHVPKYIIQTPDKIYRLYPDKYIRQRRWEDDNGKELTPKEKMLAKHNYKPMGA